MSIVYQQRIRHFDRPVKRRDMRGLISEQRKAEVKERRGAPSGSHSGEYTFGKVRMRMAARQGKDVSALKAKFEFMRLRERMLERKQMERRRIANARRPSVERTKINIARKRRDYIRMIDAERAKNAELDAQLDAIDMSGFKSR